MGTPRIALKSLQCIDSTSAVGPLRTTLAATRRACDFPSLTDPHITYSSTPDDLTNTMTRMMGRLMDADDSISQCTTATSIAPSCTPSASMMGAPCSTSSTGGAMQQRRATTTRCSQLTMQITKDAARARANISFNAASDVKGAVGKACAKNPCTVR